MAQAGEIRGRVLNQQGVAVPAARVSVEREDGQFRRQARTKSDGFYQIQGLGQRIYSITVSGPSGRPLLRREYFDTNLPPGERGNVGFNVFRKDGTNNWNFSVGKVFRFRGRRKKVLQFRTAFLNLFNHPQFEKPGVSMGSPRFGLITNTVNKGRVVQLSLQLNF